MFKKILTTLSAVSAAIGFFVILGTAGSADMFLINFETSCLWSAIGLAILVVGILGINFFSTDKNFF